MKLDDSILKLKGVGNKTELKLKKIGIETIGDVLQYYPRTFENRGLIKKIEDIQFGEKNLIEVQVIKEPILFKGKKKFIIKAKFKDNTGMIECVWFNMPYIKKEFKINSKYYLFGKVKWNNNTIQMENPEYCYYEDKDKLYIGKIVPIYSLSADISQKLIRKLVNQSLKLVDGIEDYLPIEIIAERNLLPIQEAIKNIHYPSNNSEYIKARRRLVFDEVFIIQQSLSKIKILSKKKSKIIVKDYTFEKLTQNLPFKLTKSQQKVIEEIISDMQNGDVTNRLIQGDVGSGKTIVAVIISYILIKAGYQVALMAPTEVLATQHYKSLTKLFSILNIEVVLLTGSQKVKIKKESLVKIKDGSAKMIIGTHALIQEKVVYNKLGLVITDEQHRFGVNQRINLKEKGINPHVLVMTATPIPRTLGLIVYGDLSISVIDELPPNRIEIETYLVTSAYRERLNRFIMNQVKKGGQCYIVCPLIKETEKAKGIAVESYVEKILDSSLKNLTIEILHGKMLNDKKNEIMKKFNKNEINILIATTVIEVGINVPNATLMIIEDAYKLGLSQLHQLRGRVGRGSNKSYCILVSDNTSKISKRRLELLCNTTDGFKISEKDLEFRGTGDFFGIRQHGLPEFKITNLSTDLNIVKESLEVIKKIKKKEIQISEEGKKNLEKKIYSFMNIVKKEISL